MKKGLIIYGIIFLLFSCTNGKEQKVKIIYPLENASTSLVASIDKVIYLSNKDDVFLNNISGIKFYDNKFYVFDFGKNNTIFIFNDKGSLIARTTLGKGPGELTFPTGFFISNDTLHITDWPGVKLYSLEGKFLASRKLQPGFYANTIYKLKNNEFLIYGCSGPICGSGSLEDSIYMYHVVDNSMKKETHSLIPLNDIQWAALNYSKSVSFYKNHCLILSPYSKIYSFDGEKCSESYRIDFNQKTFKDEEVYKGIRFYSQMLQEDTRYGYLDNLNETDDFLTFSYVGKGKTRPYVVYSKDSEKCSDFLGILKESNVPNSKPLNTLNNSFICVFYPGESSEYEILKAQQQGILDSEITIYSNPVIFIISLK